ncbi:hypothetical protein HMPREF1983_00643 [Gemella bergeri ATCC 700627]|uniref:Uncharacterized protein n=1 Tax=Gemella bergeri ATCC 700627 TaxID=1321820 RepID=U2Q817_9BACL|nr:hypothetical protein HMPREF1983_00643 [Gemella bergeri ATCC 700627]
MYNKFKGMDFFPYPIFIIQPKILNILKEKCYRRYFYSFFFFVKKCIHDIIK